MPKLSGHQQTAKLLLSLVLLCRDLALSLISPEFLKSSLLFPGIWLNPVITPTRYSRPLIWPNRPLPVLLSKGTFKLDDLSGAFSLKTASHATCRNQAWIAQVCCVQSTSCAVYFSFPADFTSEAPCLCPLLPFTCFSSPRTEICCSTLSSAHSSPLAWQSAPVVHHSMLWNDAASASVPFD